MKRLLIVVFAISSAATFAQGGRPAEHWVGAWSTALVNPTPAPVPAAPAATAPAQAAPAVTTTAPPVPPGPPPVRAFNDQTLRLIVHPTLAGERLRLVLSNAFGTAPLAIGAAHVALRAHDADINPASD